MHRQPYGEWNRRHVPSGYPRSGLTLRAVQNLWVPANNRSRHRPQGAALPQTAPILLHDLSRLSDGCLDHRQHRLRPGVDGMLPHRTGDGQGVLQRRQRGADDLPPIRFHVPIPVRNRIQKKLISESVGKIESPLNSDCLARDVVRGYETSMRLKDGDFAKAGMDEGGAPYSEAELPPAFNASLWSPATPGRPCSRAPQRTIEACGTRSYPSRFPSRPGASTRGGSRRWRRPWPPSLNRAPQPS